jgi:O-antigen/teichoic acid export membrane protein
VNIPAVILFKLKGALFALLITDTVASVYYLINLKKPRFHFRIALKKTLVLLKTGFVLFVNKLSESFFWNIDIIVLTAMTATKNIGIYSMALNTMGTAEPFSQAINMTIYRKILVEGGRHGPAIKDHFKKYAESLLAAYLMINSVILGCAILFYMFIVRTILTKYADSLPLMVILGFGYLVYISRTFFTYYLNVTNQLFKWLWIVLGGLALNALLDVLAIKLGYGLPGVAVSCMISFLFISSFILGVSLKQVYGTVRSALALFCKTLFSSALAMMIVLAFSRWNLKSYPTLPVVDQQILWGIIDLALKGLVFSGAAIGIYSLIFRRDAPYKELKPVFLYMVKSFSGKSRAAKKAPVAPN